MEASKTNGHPFSSTFKAGPISNTFTKKQSLETFQNFLVMSKTVSAYESYLHARGMIPTAVLFASYFIRDFIHSHCVFHLDRRETFSAKGAKNITWHRRQPTEKHSLAPVPSYMKIYLGAGTMLNNRLLSAPSYKKSNMAPVPSYIICRMPRYGFLQDGAGTKLSFSVGWRWHQVIYSPI